METALQANQSIPRRVLLPKDAACYLNVAEQTLAIWRLRGTGPKFVSINSKTVRYLLEDLDAYLDARRRQSTSETAPAA
jgi:hypothetical protein